MILIKYHAAHPKVPCIVYSKPKNNWVNVWFLKPVGFSGNPIRGRCRNWMCSAHLLYKTSKEAQANHNPNAKPFVFNHYDPMCDGWPHVVEKPAIINCRAGTIYVDAPFLICDKCESAFYANDFDYKTEEDLAHWLRKKPESELTDPEKSFLSVVNKIDHHWKFEHWKEFPVPQSDKKMYAPLYLHTQKVLTHQISISVMEKE